MRYIGINANLLEPYVNKERCVRAIIEGNSIDELSDVISHCDDATILLLSGYVGESCIPYILFDFVHFHNKRPNKQISLSEICEKIKDAVQCVCDINREDIDALIEFDVQDVRGI